MFDFDVFLLSCNRRTVFLFFVQVRTGSPDVDARHNVSPSSAHASWPCASVTQTFVGLVVLITSLVKPFVVRMSACNVAIKRSVEKTCIVILGIFHKL